VLLVQLVCWLPAAAMAALLPAPLLPQPRLLPWLA